MMDGQVRVLVLLGNVREAEMHSKSIHRLIFKLMIFRRCRLQIMILKIGAGAIQSQGRGVGDGERAIQNRDGIGGLVQQ